MAQVTYTIEDGTCFADFDNRKKTVWKERWVNPSEFEIDTAYLTFSSDSYFALKMSSTTKSWDGIIEYSTNGSTWNEWDAKSINSALHENNYVIYLRGSNNTKITKTTSSSWQSFVFVFAVSDIYCDGNIETLLDYQTVKAGEHPEMESTCFKNLFSNCSALKSAPELPSVILAEYCYQNMFSYTSISIMPDLPATNIPSGAYMGMFQGCTSLITIGIISATILEGMKNFQDMFLGCSSLKQAPSLSSITTLANTCFANMFKNCSSLEELPRLSCTSINNYAYQSMFSGCSKIKVSATQSEEYSTEYRIPITGEGSVGTNSLSTMFANTGGTFTGTPTVNTTYYTSNKLI